jgi:hypothetical protein
MDMPIVVRARIFTLVFSGWFLIRARVLVVTVPPAVTEPGAVVVAMVMRHGTQKGTGKNSENHQPFDQLAHRPEGTSSPGERKSKSAANPRRVDARRFLTGG